MVATCPKCGAENRIPDLTESGQRYRCGKCKATLSDTPKAPDTGGERRITLKVVRVEMRVALLYLLGITAAEAFLAFQESLVGAMGIICYVIVLIALIIHSLRVTEYRSRGFLLSLALVPLYRIAGFFASGVTFVLEEDGGVVYYAIQNSLLLAAAVVLMRTTRLRVGEAALAFGKPRSQLLVGLTGIIFGPALYYVVKPEPLIPELDLWKLIIAAFILLIGVGAEELTFRGILQRTSTKAFGHRGLLYVSLIFAVIHFGHISGANLSILSIPFIFIVAMFYSWVVMRTGSLLGVVLSHFIVNIFFFLIAPLAF